MRYQQLYNITYWPDSGNNCKTNAQKLEYINNYIKEGWFSYEPAVARKFEKELLDNKYILEPIIPFVQ